MQVREGRRPSRPYDRLRRDGILLLCRVARRKPTPEEREIISNEAKELANAGYHYPSIVNEDADLIDQIYLGGSDDDDDDDDGGESVFSHKPTL